MAVRKKAQGQSLTDMVQSALKEAGGADYLARQAEENPRLFLALVAKVLPTQLTGEDGGPVRMVVQTGVPRDEDGDLEM